MDRRTPAQLLLADIEPMLLTERSVPTDATEWIYELKYDGYRLLAAVADGTVALKTRNGADATRWFPEITASLARIQGAHVLDGEVVVLDQIGRSDFERLHRRARMRCRKPGSDPVVYCAFDLLMLAGEDLREQPLEHRKEALRGLLGNKPPSILFVSSVQDGVWLYQQALRLSLEGIVAKRLGSRYRSGERSDDWVKVRRPGAVPATRFKR